MQGGTYKWISCRNTKSGSTAPPSPRRNTPSWKPSRNDPKEIESRFFGPLEFGTAGLRGTMYTGLHNMNIHVIRWATQGFADVIAAEGEEGKRRGRCHLHGLPEPLHGVCPRRR